MRERRQLGTLLGPCYNTLMATRAKKKPSKATQAKKKNLALTILVIVVALSAVIIGSLFIGRLLVANQNAERKDRIETIYANLNLGDDYFVSSSNIFGDKRLYSWDRGRSFSSSVTYIHAASVPETLAEVDTAIKASGFAFIDEPYPGDPASTQYHYKSKKGEYIRLYRLQ